MHTFSRASELVDIWDLLETDIFQMLMERDCVERSDFLRLCNEKRREISRPQQLADA